MEGIKAWIKSNILILSFALAKLILQLATATNYGLQRDAYLYLAQSRHLDWGYFSTPPFLAFITRIHTSIWGDSLLAVRLLPALAGTATIFLVGWLIKQMKGGWLAQLTGLAAFLLSPAFLRPAGLLQPVNFNILFWLLAAIVVLQMVRKQDSRLLLWMIPVLGLGWLNKYSMALYAVALLLALLISPHRKLLWSKYLPIALAGGLILILPNLLWQHSHNWPVFHHMDQLSSTQLENVKVGDFLVAQILMAMPALPVWMGGLIFLVFNKSIRPYRLFAIAYGLTLVIVILLKGKFYYTIGAYIPLIVFGALAWEKWGKKPRRFLVIMVLSTTLNIGLSVLPFSLPVYPPERMTEYSRKMIDRGMGTMLTWEDGIVHELPQDYADMLGWDELGMKVWEFYDTLPDSVREKTWVYGEHYGCAGAAAYFRPTSVHPEVYSFNDAFMEWIPREAGCEYLIYMGYSDRLPTYFDSLRFVGEVEHPYFREKGLPIWFGSHPTPKLHKDWEETWQGSAGRFSR